MSLSSLPSPMASLRPFESRVLFQNHPRASWTIVPRIMAVRPVSVVAGSSAPSLWAAKALNGQSDWSLSISILHLMASRSSGVTGTFASAGMGSRAFPEEPKRACLRDAPSAPFRAGPSPDPTALKSGLTPTGRSSEISGKLTVSASVFSEIRAAASAANQSSLACDDPGAPFSFCVKTGMKGFGAGGDGMAYSWHPRRKTWSKKSPADSRSPSTWTGASGVSGWWRWPLASVVRSSAPSRLDTFPVMSSREANPSRTS